MTRVHPRPLDWDALYEDYCASCAAPGPPASKAQFAPSPDVLDRIANPSNEDARWLIAALREAGVIFGRQWFACNVFNRSNSVAEVFFVPMLDTAIDEVDPSFNRNFVEPCLRTFGPRRVNEYLLGVVESGSDIRKAGAANALYWAGVSLVFPRGTESFSIEHATPESRASYELLQDIWDRKARLLLETFVSNANVHVRRSVISKLDLHPEAYPDSHHPLIAQAIAIARAHEDDYIRHRVEIQLGDTSRGYPALPHRPR